MHRARILCATVYTCLEVGGVLTVFFKMWKNVGFTQVMQSYSVNIDHSEFQSIKL